MLIKSSKITLFISFHDIYCIKIYQLHETFHVNSIRSSLLSLYTRSILYLIIDAKQGHQNARVLMYHQGHWSAYRDTFVHSGALKCKQGHKCAIRYTEVYRGTKVQPKALHYFCIHTKTHYSLIYFISNPRNTTNNHFPFSYTYT